MTAFCKNLYIRLMRKIEKSIPDEFLTAKANAK